MSNLKISSFSQPVPNTNSFGAILASAANNNKGLMLTTEEKAFFKDWAAKIRQSLDAIKTPGLINRDYVSTGSGTGYYRTTIDTDAMLITAKSQLTKIESQIDKPLSTNRDVQTLMPCDLEATLNSLAFHSNNNSTKAAYDLINQFKTEAEATLRNNKAIVGLIKDKNSGYLRKDSDGIEFFYEDTRRCVWPN